MRVELISEFLKLRPSCLWALPMGQGARQMPLRRVRLAACVFQKFRQYDASAGEYLKLRPSSLLARCIYLKFPLFWNYDQPAFKPYQRGSVSISSHHVDYSLLCDFNECVVHEVQELPLGWFRWRANYEVHQKVFNPVPEQISPFLLLLLFHLLT